MGDFKEKKNPIWFSTLSCFTRSGVRTICELVEAVSSLVMVMSEDHLDTIQIIASNSCYAHERKQNSK